MKTEWIRLPQHYAQYILAECGISVPFEDINGLIEGDARRYTLKAGDWVVRIFTPFYPSGKLYADAAFIHGQLLQLADKGPFEQCVYSGLLWRGFEYTVSRFVPGRQPTDDEIRNDPILRTQIADAIKVMRSNTSDQMTAEQYMRPKIKAITKFLAKNPELEKRVGTLVDDFKGYKMVLSHNDLHRVNMIIRGNSLAAIIDWEFMSYRPEFYEAAFFLIPQGVYRWGRNFSKIHGLGFEKYSARLIWTVVICNCLDVTHTAEDFYHVVRRNLEIRGM